MTRAPNETTYGHARKNSLIIKRDKSLLTYDEALELRDLTKVATSHLKIVKNIREVK